jgi:hypothetical protein
MFPESSTTNRAMYAIFGRHSEVLSGPDRKIEAVPDGRVGVATR